MATIPTMSGREVVEALRKFGWRFDRQRGSHIILIKPGMTSLSVPDHKEVGKGTLRALIQDAGLTVDEFKAAR